MKWVGRNLGVLSLILGVVLSSVGAASVLAYRVEKLEHKTEGLPATLREMKTDIRWIREKLDD